MTSATTPKRKRNIVATLLSMLSLALWASIQRECTREQLADREAEAAKTTVTVWVPSALGALMPYSDVQILDRAPNYVRFRTRDGQIIDQQGTYRIDLKQRSDLTWSPTTFVPQPAPVTVQYLELGLAKEQVASLLGPPTAEDAFSWHYGRSQVTFHDDRVSGWAEFDGFPLKTKPQ